MSELDKQGKVVRQFFYNDSEPCHTDEGRALNVRDHVIIDDISFWVVRTGSAPEKKEQRLWVSRDPGFGLC